MTEIMGGSVSKKKLFENDPPRYLPFMQGRYTTAPGLRQILRREVPKDRLIFQIDKEYDRFLQNKEKCRVENIHKYYCEQSLNNETSAVVNDYLIHQLTKEHPGIFKRSGKTLLNRHTEIEIGWDEHRTLNDFSRFSSLFDALCCQVQEDLAVWQLNDQGDWIAAVHLCAPNHWAAEDKIGKPFNMVHEPVPGMEKIMVDYRKLLKTVVQKGPFTRFGWGISTDCRLNHHPDAPQGMDPELWKGRRLDEKSPQFFVRVERQNFVGFPEVNAFLFTIRTYFYSVEELISQERNALRSAIQTMSDDTLQYKGLAGLKSVLMDYLRS